MLSVEDNAMLTQVGPGTPTGELFRRFWLPAMLSSELPEPDGDPIRLRLLGEDLVTYRDSEGRVGCVDAYCPHRGAPMFFGRNEENGLRGAAAYAATYAAQAADHRVAVVDAGVDAVLLSNIATCRYHYARCVHIISTIYKKQKQKIQ